MIIEITGAGFANKGAQLMLATVCQKLRDTAPDIQLCIPMDHHAHEDRAQYGLYFTLRAPEHSIGLRRLGRDILNNIVGRTRLSRAYGLIREQEVDGLIDISGYAFGDKWPASKTRRLLKPAAVYKRVGKPVVMLPQMLGPFTKPGQADAFRRLANHLDLIFAREQESFDHARPLVDTGKLRLAPDITIPTPPKPLPKAATRYACIVPNSKLLEGNPQQQNWAGDYLPRLALACRHIVAKGLEVRIVQHEYDSGDTQLVKELQQRVQIGSCKVVQESDPQVLKAVLGAAELVIGSRFHSLVSTLSMGVPAIALGWAHKYDALLRDFGTPEMMHYAASPVEHLIELIDRALDARDALVVALTDNKRRLVQQVEEMWLEVFDTLGIPASNSRQVAESLEDEARELSEVTPR